MPKSTDSSQKGKATPLLGQIRILGWQKHSKTDKACPKCGQLLSHRSHGGLQCWHCAYLRRRAIMG